MRQALLKMGEQVRQSLAPPPEMRQALLKMGEQVRQSLAHTAREH